MSCLICSRPFSHDYKVLSSVKLQSSDFSTKQKRLLINTLNSNGSNIDLVVFQINIFTVTRIKR